MKDKEFSFSGELSIKKYQPFTCVSDYYLISQSDHCPNILLHYGPGIKKYFLEIKSDGHIPKSGLLVCRQLEPLVKNCEVLEIGCGETGIISIHCAVYNANSVDALEIVPEAALWAIQNIKSNRITNVNIINTSIHNYNSEKKYDLIISNPPQLPMDEYSPHDSGGKDGRSIILEIISFTKTHLKKNGKLLLLLFDFIGVDAKYGKRESLISILEKNNFSVEILSRDYRKINSEGKTIRFLDQIKAYYPNYIFLRDADGDLLHSIKVLLATKKD